MDSTSNEKKTSEEDILPAVNSSMSGTKATEEDFLPDFDPEELPDLWDPSTASNATKKPTYTSTNPNAPLSDRFQYKMDAMFGVYDPLGGNDDENQNGNILNAMMTFPTSYTFIVVGKTGGDEKLASRFETDVKEIVLQQTSKEDLLCESLPRGSKFTRVSVKAQVDSASVVNSIHDQLAQLDLTVMQY